MPSRFLPHETRDNETSATSTPGSCRSRQRDESDTPSPSSRVQNKSGTRRPRSQSPLAKSANHPSSTAASHHHPEVTTHVETGIADPSIFTQETRQRTRSSPSPLQAVPSPLSPPVGYYFAPQPGASGLEPRSPLNRRPPASRSSHGIETISGPPPALSTQRSYQGDSAWRYTQPVDPTRLGSRENAISSIDALVREMQPATDDSLDLDPMKTPVPTERSSKQSTPAMGCTAVVAQAGHPPDDDQDEATLRGAEFPQLPFASSQKPRLEHDRSEASQEDLFLNLAHADSPGEEGPAISNQKQRRRVGNHFSTTPQL